MSSVEGSTLTREETDLEAEFSTLQHVQRPYQVVVWNDPVNLMSYVAWVFRSYFGHSRQRAHQLMMQVHEQGRAVVATGTREQVERHVTAMHHFGLQATLEEA
ncbi:MULTISPECIES: ATP-dependent Clp protease adapter ClpS [Nesterenkonia]|uniref:ATP-dependent Clp protease adapter protein ClpS n=1 Tax=Nesterenkonia xinjiangensis TaxID=225327 RepID=A0A7Z0GJ04_9MICC|nr:MULTISPECIES: ATP-dependent Clp protease adapter ClpS [Nesterenkonia]MDZ5078616.1 ATP-dependent Clp protease adapter ClpS [Nesterenkonia sp. HG001]NYJ76643.1 ATP-dependent Clp protease adaptor protein ClpS [Nesterenkonia xinjiangensis]